MPANKARADTTAIDSIEPHPSELPCHPTAFRSHVADRVRLLIVPAIIRRRSAMADAARKGDVRRRLMLRHRWGLPTDREPPVAPRRRRPLANSVSTPRTGPDSSSFSRASTNGRRLAGSAPQRQSDFQGVGQFVRDDPERSAGQDRRPGCKGARRRARSCGRGLDQDGAERVLRFPGEAVAETGAGPLCQRS
jgi:hypothetical protein